MAGSWPFSCCACSRVQVALAMGVPSAVETMALILLWSNTGRMGLLICERGTVVMVCKLVVWMDDMAVVVLSGIYETERNTIDPDIYIYLKMKMP